MYSPLGDTQLSSLFTLFRMPFFFFLSGYLFTADPLHFSLRRKLKQILRGIVWTYAYLLLLFVCEAATISALAWLIRRHAPLLIGDKQSFNRWSQRLRLGISF